MMDKSVVRFIMCCGFVILVHILTPQVSAITRGVEDYEIGEQRTHRRPNYVEQMGIEDELFDNDGDVGPPYDTKLTETQISKEELPAFIGDYANLMRNGIILLDDSVETRTHKRGNFKVAKHNEPIADSACNCEYNTLKIDLGDDYYPRIIMNKNCSQQMCSEFHTCKSNKYELTLLKRRAPSQEPQMTLPWDLRHRWVTENKIITIACVCTKEVASLREAEDRTKEKAQRRLY